MNHLQRKMQNTHTLLNENWQWRLVSTTPEDKKLLPNSVDLTQWQGAQHSPSEIHLELLSRKLLSDYNVGQNERKIQWVGRSDWEYMCTFSTPQATVNSRRKHVELFFEGLDTFATVTLNGEVIAKSDNQFIPFRVNVAKHLADPSKKDNELVIMFESAERMGTELEKRWGARTSLMRDKKRMNMRKAQYSWGWDWGPKILNAGPNLPVYLETYDNRIDNLYVTSTLSEDLEFAQLSVQVNLGEAAMDYTKLRLDISQNGELVYSTRTSIHAGEKSQTITTDIANPKLWWPHGHGEHPIYTATASILSQDEKVIDEKQTKFGIRKIKVVQRPLVDAPGKTFMFQVNNKSIFAQGADWIPSDNLAPTMTRERYFAWIRMAQKSNVNMIRVWGGGYYETEDFWDACDEHGIMIWQDYMFACGDYPIHYQFLESVRKEAELQTIRFRNRASLALLCGGNEDFMFADWAGPYDHDDMKGPFEDTSFPQRKIYLDVLLNVAGEFAPHVQYWANSPWGGPTANDETIGDVHQWDVWHGKQLAYQDYHTLSGRFISEFGMHGYPDMRTVNVFCPDPADRHPQSQTIDCHNKGEGAEKRIARYMAENFRYTNDLEIYAYVSQLVQSEAYGYALRDWKRNFKGEGKEYCAGAIIWQLNDCYPCTSWAYIDYFLRPKPAFYTIRRTFAPISVGISRTPRSRFVDENKPYESMVPPKFDIFAHNTTTEKQDFTLVVKAFDLYTGKFVQFENASRQVSLLPGQNTELGTLTNPREVNADSLIILSTSLVDGSGAVVARLVDWPEPFRYLNWPKGTKVTTTVVAENDGWETIEIESNNPVKGVLLDVESGEIPEWEDNMVDLLPGDNVQVRVKGLVGRKITSRWLNDWEQK